MMKNSVWFTVILFAFSFITDMNGQEKIDLRNPSFEDTPRKGGEFSGPIKGWHDCSITRFPGESPPDIHPVPGYAWMVIKQPKDGNTYLGLVVRYNGTYESISQSLSTPLKKDKCYKLSVYLARSSSYKSATRRNTAVLVNFTKPAILKIWSGNEFCETAQLLTQSIPVEHDDWIEHTFEFSPEEDYKYITLAASFNDGSTEPYNGHILIDGLSSIVEVECK